jgi:hypothetical protein
MDCGEYSALKLQHEFAVRRLWRYSHPNADPVLSITGVPPSEHKLADAEAEELELSARLRAHQETCVACREVRDRIAM